MDDLIVQNGAEVLRQKAKPVSDEQFGSKELLDIVEKMKRVLADEEHGAALAAPQIGIPLRIFVVAGSVAAGESASRRSDEETGRVHAQETQEDTPLPELVCINPTLSKLSRKKIDKEEGCLSIRGRYGYVPRAEKATITAYDEYGKKFERGASGLLAQAFQHEIDHLDGVLFIDRARDVWDINEGETTTNELPSQ